MSYTIRPATIADIPHIVSHREQMFRDMGIPAEFEDMAAATELWLRHAIPSHTYRGWMATAANGEIAGGSGLLVIPWPPGPMTLDPRCGFVFNVYTHAGASQAGPGAAADGRHARAGAAPKASNASSSTPARSAFAVRRRWATSSPTNR